MGLTARLSPAPSRSGGPEALHKSVFKASNRFDYFKAHPYEADLPASASRGEFSEEFIAEVLAAEEECEMGLCTRFENVEELLASLDR